MSHEDLHELVDELLIGKQQEGKDSVAFGEVVDYFSERYFDVTRSEILAVVEEISNERDFTLCKDFTCFPSGDGSLMVHYAIRFEAK